MNHYRDTKSEDGLVWNDNMLNIKFPVKKLKVSKKDKKFPPYLSNLIQGNIFKIGFSRDCM